MANSVSLQNDFSDRRRRIGHLAVLPVFFNIRGKPVLVIGGGEPAAWKAELLAQAGADVRIVAENFCNELSALAKRNDLQGKVQLHARNYEEADFIGIVMVVADAENDNEAAAVALASMKHGIPCNIIDRPEFSTFQFGAIVNRSPVVIGISTDGASPVLGQTIRARIESILPDSLSLWAGNAREIRSVVLSRFRPGIERRHFWSNFSKLAFGPFLPDSIWDNCQTSNKGSLKMIWVNPLDPDELTLKAIRILQAADVIYFDCRIDSKVIDLARREAVRISLDNWSDPMLDNCYKTEIDKFVCEGRQVAFVGSTLPDHSSTYPAELPMTKAVVLPLDTSKM